MKLIRIIIALAASTLFVVGNNIRWGRKFGGSEVGQGDVLVTKYCPYFHDGIIPANVTRGYSEQKVPHGRKCMKKRKYFPSPYERRHLAKTNELTLIQNFTDRRKALVSFITSDVEVDYAHRWLARVAAHMQGGKVDIVADDWEFMSYFDVTTICRGSPDISSYEFIEPLSLHARNPFSVFRIMKDWPMPRAHPSGTKIPERLTQAIDYILVYRNPSLPNVISRTDSHYRPQTEHTPMPHVKHFMLDAGTSRFDSSLWWFICAYSKVGTYLEELFGWEFTLLEPLDFWSYVPAVWNSRYHFYNAPISKDIAAPMSPLRTIKQIARKSDFVAFKLDVDTPETEIPIALEIRDNPEYSAYIDEFFFELHFNCEIVGENAWGYGKGLVNGPPDVKGLKMNRKGALELFRDYRIAGIRAHFWP